MRDADLADASWRGGLDTMTQEQPTPIKIAGKSQPVGESLKRYFADYIDERTAKGVETYGQPLHTFNGRDAGRDLSEELIDALQYQHQELLETRAERDAHAADSKHRWEVIKDLRNLKGLADPYIAVVNALPRDLRCECGHLLNQHIDADAQYQEFACRTGCGCYMFLMARDQQFPAGIGRSREGEG